MAITALPVTQDLKDWLRIQTAAEDTLIGNLLAEAQGQIEFAVGKPLTHETFTWYDDAQTLRIQEDVMNLFLQYVPVDVTSIIVKDKDGNTVPASDYVVRPDRGLICALPSVGFAGKPAFSFGSGPYTITGKGGLDTSPTYATRELPMVFNAIMEYAAYLYQQRTPGARSERAAGSSVDYEIDAATGLPSRIARSIRKLRGPVFAR